jgi:hypothetical protein
MSSAVLIQYVGFEAKTLVREYTFNIKEAVGDPRQFTLTILNEAFHSRRVRYQDAPDICSLKLQGEMATFANNPPHTHYRITDAELLNYHSAHTKPARGLFKRKTEREEDF